MAVLSLHFLAKTVIVQILIDHNDKHTEYRERAQGIIRQLQTDHYASVSEDILETFTENYPSIVSDELLCVLAPPHLRKLQLVGFSHVKDIENIHQLFRKSSKIETLSLDGCDGLISIDLCYFLCKTLTHLNSVTMESCPPITDEHVQFLLMYCPSLTHLNIAWNEDITDDVFNLQSLLRRTSQSAADQEWTAPSLNSVDVSGCRFLTSNCIRHLAKLCGSKLQALNVSYTQMDTSILWYLSGYNLETAVQLAVSQDGEMLDRSRKEERLISDLVLSHRLIKDKLEEKKQKDENGSDEESSSDEKICDGDGGKTCLEETGMSSDITNGGHAQLTGEMDKTTKPERLEVTAGQIAANLCTGEQRVEGGAGNNCDAMNEYLEEQTAAVAMTTDVSQKDTDAIEVTGEKHCVVTNCVGVRGKTEVMADGRSDNDVDVNDVEFSIHDSMGERSGSTALQSNDTLSTNGKPSNISQHEQSSTTNSLSKSSATTDIKHDRSEKVDNYPEGEESHLGENSIASENTSPSEHSSQHDKSKDDAEELSDMQAVKKTQLFQPNITSLDISNISLEHPSTDSALKEFFTANKKMRKFCISWPLLNNFTLEFIANNSPELRYLSLIDCESLSSAGIICLNKCQYLEHLDLKGVCFISDAGLAPLLTNTDSCLKYLCVAEANITDSSMQRVSKYLATKIQNFDISWCEEVTDVGIRSVVESCTSLKSLSIRQCPTSDETLLCLADNCTKLTDLNLCGVGDIEDEVVVAIARQLSLLEKIDLSWNPNLTDVAISTLLLSCTLLKEAILCGLKCISSKPFLPIVADYPRWKRCKSLLSLKLKERKLLEENGDPHLSSDEEYEDLYIPHRSTTYSPCLRHIDMEYCNQIDDDLIAEIVAICRGTLKVRDYYGQQVEPKLLKF